jgi:hypothetical protein
MRTKHYFLSMLILMTFQTGCTYVVRYDSPYHGKVVDQETREPIEGAVVLGTWGKYHYGLAGGYSEYYDAKEAVTDKNGEFTIPGEGFLMLSNVGQMGALIYKFGYTFYETGSWDTIKTGMFSSQQVKWEGDVPVFPLRKLAPEERKNYDNIPGMPSAPGQKVLQMIREIDKERIFRGYEPSIKQE